MFKCSICGKEYSDKDMNEMRLLNRESNELESYHVCPTCHNNKEDMVAYLADKKKMSPAEARHLYDYFVPQLENIEAPLLEKYVEVRVRSLRSKLADVINDASPEVTTKPQKKKMSPLQRYKTALLTCDGVISAIVLILTAIICNINVSTWLGILLGIGLGVGLFVAGYFVIDNYIRVKEDQEKLIRKVSDLIPDSEEGQDQDDLDNTNKE